jgi:hypothetical protein
MHDSIVNDQDEVPEGSSTKNASRMNVLNILNDGHHQSKAALSGWQDEEPPEHDPDLDHAFGAIDDMTQEDKFFLIQQIEDLNKNIRYCQNSSPYHTFQEDEHEDNPMEQPVIRNYQKRALDIILDEEEDVDDDKNDSFC